MTINLSEVRSAADVLFAPDAAHGHTLALVVMQSGDVVFEQYGHQPDTIFGPGSAVDADTPLVSWSMAKSITHAAVGILVGEGLLDLHSPAPVPAWKGTNKESITLQQLLEMRDGLEFIEDYIDGDTSHCIDMLFGSGKDDVAAYAAARPLTHAPGTVWNYSSGTTNIVSRIVTNAVGGREAMEALLSDRIFRPTGMTTAVPAFDDAGTFIGSSYVYATARDFARFGEMYRNDGVAADGTRVVPTGWRDHGRTFAAVDPTGEFQYGAHWWLWPDLAGAFAAHGYEGQYTLVVPDRELVVVHLGKCPADVRPLVAAQLRAIVAAAPPIG